MTARDQNARRRQPVTEALGVFNQLVHSHPLRRLPQPFASSGLLDEDLFVGDAGQPGLA